MPSKTLIIDSAETSQIRYSAGWSFLPGNDNEYLQTVSYTTTKDARFTFDFNGTSVKVYGSLSVRTQDIATLPNTSYVLDGGPPVLFHGNPSENDDHRYQQVFYSSPPLPFGNHSLVGTCVDQGSNVWIDYFVVEVPNDVPANTTIPELHVVHDKSTPSVAEILCGVLGGLLFLATTLSLYLWYRRCRMIETTGTLSTEATDGPFSPSPSMPAPNHDVLSCVESHKSSIPLWYVSSPPGSYV
ncbi:hypothetical protein PLEOSDRAFT_1102746 [Pleurotus ostreatus PC15]|uniref:Uncharacterized protein n=1 Tax=Pleurotus ostreatus (strain PC15) TaxID=1137138 RepID=A0A067NX50_PLEO1|nr:hypothetical protein PLEOSDRAFT_1102746 [Pleurotus ostreatus PC15]